jgi:quinol monooxygenase YgiN
MVIRLVRMRFHAEHVEQFLGLYQQAQPMIRSQPGCRSVRLVRQTDDAAAFATWSVWDDAAALDAYRTSAFFRSFWPQVKALFRAPAEAVSFEEIHHGDTEARR